MKKGKKNDKKKLDNLISLCEFDGTKHVSKKGKDYIDALGKLFELKNANDKPFTEDDIKKQCTLEQFKSAFEGIKDFKKICNLVANPLVIENNNITNEKIYPKDFENEDAKEIFNDKLGVVYIITCKIENNEHIIKIGSTRQPFKGRLNSYNCGTVCSWRTASTTNIKILQSMVATRKEFTLYLYNCSEYKNYTWHGVKSTGCFPTPEYLAYEDILIKKFIDCFKCKPLVNIQANATTSK